MDDNNQNDELDIITEWDSVGNNKSLLVRIGDELKSIYNYRGLLRSMVHKSFFERYRHAYLGFTWQIILPFITLLMFYIFFESGLREENKEYMWIFLACTVFPFSTMLSSLTNCTIIVREGKMIKKLYFPRILLVLAQTINGFLVFSLTYSILFVLMIVVNFEFSPALMYLPILVLLMEIFCFGTSLIVSTITVFVRDLQFFMSSMSTGLYFLSPVRREITDVSGMLLFIYQINPLTYFLESFHQIVYYGVAPELFYMAICTMLATITLIAGLIMFKKYESRFAEKI